MECNIACIYQVLEGYPTFVLKDAPFTQKILQHSWFPLPTEVQTNHQAIKLYTLPETNIAPDKWMVGRGSFPFGMTFFQGCKLLVSGRVLSIIYIYSKISSIPLKGHEETSIQNPSAAPWRAPQDSGDDARCPEGLRGASLWGEVGWVSLVGFFRGENLWKTHGVKCMGDGSSV